MSTKNISHQEIIVPQGINPLQVIEFYHQLGFQSIPHPFPQQNLANLTQSNPQVDTWLTLPPTGNRNQDWLIHITTKENGNELKQQTAQSSKLHYSVSNIKDVINALTNLGVNYDLKETVVETVDPTGQLLVFTESTHPFSTKIKEPTDVDPDTSADTSSLNLNTHRHSGVTKKIAVLTSGGDSQGMNCAVRAIARAAISKGCEAYAVWEGYQGLVDGGNKIVKLTWGEVRRYISVSGTIIGSARCKAFRTIEGRLKAAENLVLNGIDALIVIGGDGSLTGADLFRSEWPSLLDTLLKTNRITKEQADTFKHLNIVGLVGSIDNDMACTDLTIGAISSLHRICESVDNIISTAISHQRAFVIEVMGRHCGWLALMAAVCCGADWVFIPEKPPKHDEWQKQMCATVKRHRELGRRFSIIIVCEGAIDDQLQPIKLEDVSKALEEHLQMDSRTTSLGHVQRGGNPSAMDRIVGGVQGILAVQQVLEATPETPSPMIGIVENHITSISLMDAVARTKKVAEHVSLKDFKTAFSLRDPEFIDMWQAYKSCAYLPLELRKPTKKALRIGIIDIGAPAAGMNAVARTVVRLSLNKGHKPIAIMNGMAGLIRGEFQELGWLQVDNWMSRGGTELGTNRTLPSTDYGMVAYQLQRYEIDALVVVGGFEAYHAVTQLTENKKSYPAFNIPIACIPATISNNVPGTAFSLGSDTSLNAITEACDRITQSAAASHRRVFVVEVQGGRSGYLATMAGLCVGASRVYTPEEGINLKSLQQDVEHMKDKFKGDSVRNDTKYHVGRLILRTETSSKTYTTDLISSVFQTESEGLFDSRTAVLGHIQQGGITSPMDRIRGTRLGYHAFVWLEGLALENLNTEGRVCTPRDDSACVIGVVSGKLQYTPISNLQAETDWEFRRPKHNWWDKYPAYNRMLAHYPSAL